MKILSQANAKKKTKCLRVSNFAILLTLKKIDIMAVKGLKKKIEEEEEEEDEEEEEIEERFSHFHFELLYLLSRDV